MVAEAVVAVTADEDVIAPAVHGVSPAPLAPQHVLKASPLTGAEGFEVSPYGSTAIMPFADRDRFGLAPLA